MGSDMKKQKSDIDRISNVPDHVAHHILSFLELEDLARLYRASKKLREFCLSTPFLNVNGIALAFDKRATYINSVDRLFALRKGMATKSITIRWPFTVAGGEERFRIFTWLYNAIGCQVQFLDLEIIVPKETYVFSLPFHVIHCETLKELKLNLRGGILDELPSSGGFPNLEILFLKNLKLSNDTFGEWISSHCKYLKKLRIENILGIRNISINSSSLQSLRISANDTTVCNISISADRLNYLYLWWYFTSSSGKSIKISAPNLQCLTWSGYIVDSYCLDNLKHMKTSAIYLTLSPEFNNNENLSGLLRSICDTKTLYLDFRSSQIMFKQGCLPSHFLNLSCLRLFTNNLNDDLVPAIACFLKGTPHLQSLNIRYHAYLYTNVEEKSKTYGFKIEYWESQCLTFVDELKTATIECFNGDNELELIKYLLKHGRALQKMTILYPTDLENQSIYLAKISCLKDCEKVSAAEIVLCHYK